MLPKVTIKLYYKLFELHGVWSCMVIETLQIGKIQMLM